MTKQARHEQGDDLFTSMYPVVDTDVAQPAKAAGTSSRCCTLNNAHCLAQRR